MTTSKVLRTLQAKGFLLRQEHHTDTRAKAVALTEKGKKITREAVKIVEHFDGVFFAPLGNKVSEFNKKLQLLLTQSL
jgi:DNA-binding MarR family transcriptional regulator